jgi:hypothetical protein
VKPPIRSVASSWPRLLKSRCGERGLVAVLAHEHDPHIAAGQLRIAVLTARVELPLQHVARHVARARHDAVALALGLGADVHEHDALHSVRLGRGPSLEPRAGLGQEIVDASCRHATELTLDPEGSGQA